MANPSHYIRLLAPARWHLAEVPVEGPLSREGSSPHARSAPEPGLTHCTRMSAHNKQQPQTAPVSGLCPTHGFPPRRRSSAGAALTGWAQTSCGRSPSAAPRSRGPAGAVYLLQRPPRRSKAPAGTQLQLGHSPGGWELSGWTLLWRFQT